MSRRDVLHVRYWRKAEINRQACLSGIFQKPKVKRYDPSHSVS
jgi:hypothetical protein